MSTVDVIVPCHCYGHFLKQCVASVLAQSGPIVRVLIIDDASPDASGDVAADLASGDSRVTVFQHAVNKGHIGTYNEGIEWASADYFLILSADDYLLPGALERATSLMDAYPEIGFTYGNAIRLDMCSGTTNPINAVAGKDRYKIMSGLNFIEASGATNIVPGPTAVIRTALQKRVGKYRRDLPHSGDMEMWLRLAAHGGVGAINAQQAVYRRHGNNMSLGYMANNRLGDLRQARAALEGFFATCSDNLPCPQLLRRRLFWSLACNAIGCASEALDNDDIAICDQLSTFGLETCPESENTFRWMRLRMKRFVTLKLKTPLSSAPKASKQISTEPAEP